MQYRMLGPLEVLGDDGPLPLGGAKQRALLALLLLHAGRVVTRERLIDDLWGDAPPATARTTVQVYVSRLRKLLPANALVTRGAGYALEDRPRRARPDGSSDCGKKDVSTKRSHFGADRRSPSSRRGSRGSKQRASRNCTCLRSRSASTPTSPAAVTPSSSASSRSGRRTSTPRALPRPIDARPLSLRPPGRGAGRLPERAGCPRRARPRAERTAAPARAADPESGRRARSAARTPGTPPVRLPVFRHVFVGRARELAEIADFSPATARASLR